MSSVCAYAQTLSETPAVSPYRPSVSSPAQLPFPGQLELDMGWLSSHDSGGARTSLPYQWKLAFNQEWGVLIGGEAQIWSRENSLTRQHGSGDTSLTLKRAFLVNESEAWGVEIGAKLATARSGFGSGKQDLNLNLIYSRDLGAVHLDVNGNVTQLGAVELGESRLLHGLSTSLSAPMSEQWAANLEWSGSYQRGAGAQTQFLMALVYSPSRRLSLDVGMSRKLDQHQHVDSWFVGMVMPIARLF
ncbi:MAG: transporter [Burkholderiales bacterium]|nr:transporter [Burkholderiales bacterium]